MDERTLLQSPPRSQRSKPSRAKNTTPVLVLFMTVVLAGSSAAGFGLLALILRSTLQHTARLNASLAFVVIASTLSSLYLFLHTIAAVRNDPIGLVRPPVSKLHNLCFTFARLSIVAWIIAIVTTSVVVSQTSTCVPGTYTCNLRILNLSVSVAAAIALGTLLTVLESARYPFRLPFSALAHPTITCRISAFDEDLLHRSVSHRSPHQRNQSDVSVASTASRVSESTTTLVLDAEKELIDRVKKMMNVKSEPILEVEIVSKVDAVPVSIPASEQKISVPGEFPTEEIVKEVTIVEKAKDVTMVPAATLNRARTLSQSTSNKEWGQQWAHLVPRTPTPTATLSRAKTVVQTRGWGQEWSHLAREPASSIRPALKLKTSNSYTSLTSTSKDSGISLGHNRSLSASTLSAASTSYSPYSPISLPLPLPSALHPLNQPYTPRRAASNSTNPKSQSHDSIPQRLCSPLSTVSLAPSPSVTIRPDFRFTPQRQRHGPTMSNGATSGGYEWNRPSWAISPTEQRGMGLGYEFRGVNRKPLPGPRSLTPPATSSDKSSRSLTSPLPSSSAMVEVPPVPPIPVALSRHGTLKSRPSLARRNSSRQGLMRKSSLDCRVPGAFVDYGLRVYDEIEERLDGHLDVVEREVNKLVVRRTASVKATEIESAARLTVAENVPTKVMSSVEVDWGMAAGQITKEQKERREGEMARKQADLSKTHLNKAVPIPGIKSNQAVQQLVSNVIAEVKKEIAQEVRAERELEASQAQNQSKAKEETKVFVMEVKEFDLNTNIDVDMEKQGHTENGKKQEKQASAMSNLARRTSIKEKFLEIAGAATLGGNEKIGPLARLSLGWGELESGSSSRGTGRGWSGLWDSL